MESQSQKRPKTTEASCVQQEIDRISQLPDEVLHHILSFLDIFDVVQLSVLSKRWKSLWTTMPCLDFDIDRYYYSRLLPPSLKKFEDFINWVLMYRGSSRITRFRLRVKCFDESDTPQIMRWVRVAALRDVCELELKFSPYEAFELPSWLITCESLRVLRLRLSLDLLCLPTNFGFCGLRSLHLHSVDLSDEGLTKRLLSGCTLLEDLSLGNCVVRNMSVLDISSYSLKRLIIHSDQYDAEDGDGFRHCEIRTSCPNLLSFTYMGPLAGNYSLDNLSSLKNMYLGISQDYMDCSFKKIGSQACKILEQVENISFLKLDLDVIWYLSYVIEELLCFSTTFHRLESLNLSVGLDGDFTQVMFLLLGHCPNLESLTLMSAEFYSREQNLQWQLHDEGSEYWRSHLKSVRLTNYTGNKHEMRFVRFMFKNGVALEKFIIIWSDEYVRSLVAEKKVLKFPRASSHVEVEFLAKRMDWTNLLRNSALMGC